MVGLFYKAVPVLADENKIGGSAICSKDRLPETLGKPFAEPGDPIPPMAEEEICGVFLDYSHPPISGYPPITQT